MELVLRPRAMARDGDPLARYNPLQYEVLGLPPNRVIWIGELSHRMTTGRWRILPITVLEDVNGQGTWVKGEWIGDYESPEVALAAIDEEFLKDPALWHDVPEDPLSRE